MYVQYIAQRQAIPAPFSVFTYFTLVPCLRSFIATEVEKNINSLLHNFVGTSILYRVFRVQADWTFILPLELSTKELRHLSRKMPPQAYQTVK
jgi:hypothetical protein